MSILLASTPRKLTSTSFTWRTSDHGYAALDPTSRVDSAVAYIVAEGMEEIFFPDFRQSELKRYLRKRKLPDEFDKPIVNEEKSCFSGVEGVVEVSQLNRFSKRKDKYYKVSINNLIQSKQSFYDKVMSLNHLKVSCTCPRKSFQCITRPSKYQRSFYKDEVPYGEVPDSFIESVFCKHAYVAIDYLVFYYNVEGFGVFGLPQNVIDVSKEVIKRQLEFNRKLPNYMMSPTIRSIYKPLLTYLP